VLYPRFLTGQEQDLLLDHSLTRLDKMERPRARKRGGPQDAGATEPRREASRFRAEEEYSFEAGHFDQVISGYREMQVGQFVISPTDATPTRPSSLEPILARLQALLPDSPRPPLIHLLHLSSQGRIDPHVDNLEASGSTILGLSLGSTRVMRLGHQAAPIHTHLKVLLPPGSVYIQRYPSISHNLT
jgi:alkylated DNA repair protein alkB family protein 7